MAKVLIFSDNHGDIDIVQNVINIELPDLCINAGDHEISSQSARSFFNYFVDGNNDMGTEKIKVFSVENVRILLTHGHLQWSANENKWFRSLRKLGKKNNANVVVFGHSHREIVDMSMTPYLINPGSILLPRNSQQHKSYALLHIDSHDINALIKYYTVNK